MGMELLGGIILIGIGLRWLLHEIHQLRHTPAATLLDAAWDYVLDVPYNIVVIFGLFCIGGYLLRAHFLGVTG